MTDALMEIAARLVELLHDDAPLHDAVVRLINAAADAKECQTALSRERLSRIRRGEL